eukprot:g1813.t1
MQVMSQLIEDVVGDPAVAHLCQDLPPPSTPFFKQLPLPIEDASAKSLREAQPVLDAKQQDEGEGASAPPFPADDTEASELILKIMENTMFNIVQEISHDEMDLKRTPRRVVMMESAPSPKN